MKEQTMGASRLVDAWHIAVLIPARNEEVLLGRCLRSVLRAAAMLPAGVSCDVVVVSDCSTDGTASIAALLLGEQGEVVASVAGCVGSARAQAADRALERCRLHNPAKCWLANTDADCEVPSTWLTDQVGMAALGYTAVAGVIDVDCFTEHQALVESRFRTTYKIHADWTHPHVHGANLGVRADAYLRAGGWAPLQTAEDHDLWMRLDETSAVRIAYAGLQVLTSGRREGRAPRGFADALAAHNQPADETARELAA